MLRVAAAPRTIIRRFRIAMADAPRTLFDKLWDMHAVLTREDGETLLFVDRHFLHEGSFHAFGKLAARGAEVARPDLTFGVADHYVPTRGRGQPIPDEGIRRMVEQLSDNTARHGIELFGLEDPRQGIVHVVGPEQGLTLPGLPSSAATATPRPMGPSAPSPSASARPRLRMCSRPRRSGRRSRNACASRSTGR